MWPIASMTGDPIGFGARRLGEEDRGPKYLNTPETAIYRKSQVLYGLDMARRAISSQRRVVVVEGYTDVMAAQLAGVECAVATCGTAFGAEHVRIVRRLIGDRADPAAGVMLADGSAYGGEVVFTFDGDAAGQKAALKAFQEDQSFAAQTFVAVDPGGLDPRDPRHRQHVALRHGPLPQASQDIRRAVDAPGSARHQHRPAPRQRRPGARPGRWRCPGDRRSRPGAPRRASAWASLSHVSTPKPTGTPVSSATRLSPSVAARHT